MKLDISLYIIQLSKNKNKFSLHNYMQDQYRIFKLWKTNSLPCEIKLKL